MGLNFGPLWQRGTSQFGGMECGWYCSACDIVRIFRCLP